MSGDFFLVWQKFQVYRTYCPVKFQVFGKDWLSTENANIHKRFTLISVEAANLLLKKLVISYKQIKLSYPKLKYISTFLM